MTDQPKSSRNTTWLFILGGIILVVLLILAVPNVRASISSWLGLSVAPSTQVPIAAVTLVALETPTVGQLAAVTEVSPTSAPTEATSTQKVSLPLMQSAESSGTTVDFSRLSSHVGWNVLTPGYLPDGYKYQSAYFDTNNKMLALTYLVTRPLPGATDPSLTSSETITLLEAQKNDFIPMQIAPDTSVVDVQVNGAPAAFTTGGWDTQFVKDNNEPGGGKMVSSWRNDLPVKNLYWQVGDVYLMLVTADDAVTQQDLVDIASSIGK